GMPAHRYYCAGLQLPAAYKIVTNPLPRLSVSRGNKARQAVKRTPTGEIIGQLRRRKNRIG
ncbi:MAG: hypothetical protein ACRDCV_05355, partial [Plesiomonas shigelloides]